MYYYSVRMRIKEKEEFPLQATPLSASSSEFFRLHFGLRVSPLHILLVLPTSSRQQAVEPRTETTAMVRQRPVVPSLLLFLLLALVSPAARGAETPQYTTVHAESDFEVRLYHDTVWMSAPSDYISFHVATKLGFHRLFQYLMGANLNSSRIRMTTPIITSIVPGAGPLHSSAYFVRLYLPAKFQAAPPVALPELNLHPDRWPSHCIAVRSFSGYARDNNVVEEAEKLAMSLSRSPWANSTNYPSENAYSIAQYNSPFRIIGRVNEVWFDVDCKSTGVETY